jgi:hypothetical protein
MIPGKYNMVCPQGSTFIQSMRYLLDEQEVDLTTYSAKMQVREKHISPTAIIDMSSDNNLITLTSSGTITLTISDTVTETFAPKEYVYDLELINPQGQTTRILEGFFLVTPEVTR